MHDTVPSPGPAQHGTRPRRHQLAQQAPVSVIEKINVVANDLKWFKQLCSLSGAEDLRIGIIRTVGIAAQPFRIAYSPLAPMQRLVAFDLVSRKSHSPEQCRCAPHFQRIQAKLAQKDDLNDVVDQEAVIE